MRETTETDYGSGIVVVNGCEFHCNVCDATLRLNNTFELANVHTHVCICAAGASKRGDATSAAAAILLRRANERKQPTQVGTPPPQALTDDERSVLQALAETRQPAAELPRYHDPEDGEDQ